MLEVLIYIIITIVAFCLYLYFTKKTKVKKKFKKVEELPAFDKDIIEEVREKLSKRKEFGSPRKLL